MNRASFYFFGIIYFVFFQGIPFAVSEQYRQNQLEAKIAVPVAYSLIRGDVPVYGIACGRDFEKYRLDYGAGENPQAWENIVVSNVSQENFQNISRVDFSIDKTIPGNLGMWDTGLDEYQYGQHQSGLPMGQYILRLTVRDKNGNIEEDKVPVEVGRVVLNAFPSQLHSDDGNAILTIQEHSLFEPAKIFSLKALSSEKIKIPEGFKRISSVYEINPPGEQFLQPCRLTVKYDRNYVVNVENLGIFVFDTDLKEWRLLETYRNGTEDFLETDISVLPRKFALYTILESSRASNADREKAIVTRSSVGSFLSRDSFENDAGFWTSKYDTAGVLLERDSRKSKNGKYCLKVTNLREGGNFAIARRAQFDAAVYPRIRFDYKISKNVKINMQVKVNKKWYDIVFTDDEKVYWDINMEKIGAVEGIIADNRWHTAEINLYKMFKGRVDTFVVDEIVFADWDSTGFKKLEMGHNKKGAVYWLDNFTLVSSGSGSLSPEPISFYPLQNATWEINTRKGQSNTGVSRNYYIGIDKVQDGSFVISKTDPELTLVFGAIGRKQSYLFRLVCKRKVFNVSWVVLNKFEILLNGIKVKECYSDGSEEPIVVDIPVGFIKEGKNFMKFKWLSGIGEIELQKLSIECLTQE